MSISKELLDETRLKAMLIDFPNWTIQDGCLHQKFQFKNFTAAWSFMQAVAAIAGSLNHHPDWRNVYNWVEIKLTTHDSGGITPLDFEMAKQTDLAAKL